MRMRFRGFMAQWWSVLLAGALVVLGVIENLFGDRSGLGLTVFLMATAVFAFASRAPWTAAYGAIAVLLVGGFLWPASVFLVDSAGLLLLAVACLFGTMCELRDRLLGLAVLWVGLVAVVIRVPDDIIVQDGSVSKTAALVSNLALISLGWAVSWLVAARSRSTRELRERTARLEAERDAAAAAAVAGERARIARELHDVVAHSVSVMTVQAGGVRRLLTADQTREREALSAIEETGRRALTEMRRMVSVMRSDGSDPSSLEPQPGVATLPRLAEEVRAAGLPVTLDVARGAESLPVGVDLSVYRIVQEGLTNALKHAGPAHAEVRVSVADNAVEVVVEDDGRGAVDRNGGGHGLVGMGERVAVYGGELETGPRPGGGFRLRARLPFEVGA